MISVDPNNTEQIDSIMELAARHRSVSQTAMNERSSRSHSIFALHLKANNKAQGIVLKGTLSLVDLAGSERLGRSLATGSQMKVRTIPILHYTIHPYTPLYTSIHPYTPLYTHIHPYTTLYTHIQPYTPL